MTNLAIIGVPYWLGKKDEYSGSVEILKDTGIAEQIGAQWVDIAPQFSDDIDPVVAVNRALAEAIRNLPDDTIPLIAAADCTSCWGAMTGLQSQSPVVLWYDAHGDFNTPETSPSGFLGGMPLAAMVGTGNQDAVDAIGLELVPENKVILTDGRDLDPEEAELVNNSDIIHEINLSAVDAMRWDDPLYIHFDADIIHLDDYPAVSYPAEGGPSLSESLASLRNAVQNNMVAGILFSIWNNDLDGAEQSKEAIVTLIKAVAEDLA
jgi:arginase